MFVSHTHLWHDKDFNCRRDALSDLARQHADEGELPVQQCPPDTMSLKRLTCKVAQQYLMPWAIVSPVRVQFVREPVKALAR